MAETIKIGGELESTATGNKVADVANIKDKTQGDKSQAQINADINTALDDRYTKTETYSKSQLDSMITTPDIEYKDYDTYAAMIAETDHPAGAIYRVANYDGEEGEVADKYTEYSWDGEQYKVMAVRDHGVDSVPISGSNNLVESGGVFKEIKLLEQDLNDFSQVTQNPATFKNGYALVNNGNETLAAGWKCNNQYLIIPEPKVGDVIVWGGIANNSYTLCFYDINKNFVDAFSANSTERTITLSGTSLVVQNKAVYCRASFLIDSTPVLTYNGSNLLVFNERLINLDNTLSRNLPADAKTVGDKLGISIFEDGYVDANNVIVEDENWCYAEVEFNTPIAIGDVVVWNGIIDNANVKLNFLSSTDEVLSSWSAYTTESGGGNYRTITIGDTSTAIGSQKIRASFFKSLKDSAFISINGTIIPFTQKSKITNLEDRVEDLEETVGLIDSTADLNGDKQTMVVSLTRKKTGASTLKKYFCMAHITDTHSENNLVKRAVDFVNSRNFKNSIDCLVHTGDVQFYQFNEGDVPEYHNAMNNSVKPAFTVLGNHDVYTSTSLESLYNRYMKPMVDKGLLVAGTNIDAANYATWYYYDFVDYKIRLIALNDFDPLWNGYTKPLNTTAYSPEQITFLINTLQSVPADYTVIIADHFAPNKGDGYVGTLIDESWTMGTGVMGGSHSSLFVGNISPVIDILGAYKVKGSLVKTYTYSDADAQSHYNGISVNVDFTNSNGTLAFMACGHTHNDEIMKFTSHNNIIAIDMLGGINPTKIDSTTLIMRDNNGKSQDAINVYCVRTDERKVYVIRIGADFRNDGKAQIMTSFEY